MKQPEKQSSVQRQIDENLRRVYGEVANSELPDRFAQLLEQLKASQSNDGNSQ
ncbi:NepR family anti-sigma factor [Pseudaestuariivita atlantica]|nr:NepR family anti-sigma factor [Pseudaestuariivita atlantica]